MRATSLRAYTEHIEHYVSYALRSPDDRVARLHPRAQVKLRTTTYRDDMEEITSPPILTSWDELFQTPYINSFVTWQAWRTHPWDDDDRQHETPFRPNTFGARLVEILRQIANILDRPEAPEIHALAARLPKPRKMHNKQAPSHTFAFAELEAVAQDLMAEARRMSPQRRRNYQVGTLQAVRFSSGLLLALIWRNPLRARNWCEAQFGQHLRNIDGQWRWHLEGEDLKIGERGRRVHVFQPDISEDIQPAFEEYLRTYRPLFPGASRSRYVFLSRQGNPLRPATLLYRLKIHCHRLTNKFFFTHLSRTIFSTNHLSSGLDINSVAYGLNDHPLTVLAAYNELIAEKHRPTIAEANRQALANGNGPLTPPAIPVVPKTPRPAPVNPDQLSLI